MNVKPAINRFLEKHHTFIIKSCGFVGSMLGALVGQKLGTEALGLAMDWSDSPKPPPREKTRSLIETPGRYDMVIVYHDAHKAGTHIDVHIGEMSLIYRVKPELKKLLRFSSQGYLTKASKELIINHVRSEIDRKARVPQNLNHSPEQAVFSWVNGGSEREGYGAGQTRQIVHQSQVDVFKVANAVEFYAPKINPKPMYIYRLHPGTEKKAPILIWGTRKTKPIPKFEDRLHLKSLDPDHLDMEKLNGKVDWTTSTAKYDGSSTYLVITPEGTTAWSPRTSKLTGEPIEYTHKLPGLADLQSETETIVMMGEILYSDTTGKYLKGAAISGILNSIDVLPVDVHPEIRLYRVDQVDDWDTHDLPFWKNRQLQEHISTFRPELIKPAELMTPHQAKKAGLEGVVVVPPEKSVLQGYKIKWWLDPNDWRIDKVDLRPGEKGRIAGVVKCTSLDSHKQFNLGATAIGNELQTKHMMENPDLYEGTVVKVVSRHGHEGRSAKVVGFHDDKGKAPV